MHQFAKRIFIAAAPLLLPFMRRIRLSAPPPAEAKREGAADLPGRDAPDHL